MLAGTGHGALAGAWSAGDVARTARAVAVRIWRLAVAVARGLVWRGRIVGFSLGLLAVVGVSCWLCGSAAEKRFCSVVDSLAQHGFGVKLLEYRRGWLSSRALVALDLAGARLLCREQIVHGPWPILGGRFSPLPVAAEVVTRIELPRGAEREFRSFVGSRWNYTFRTTVSLTGDLDSRMWLAPIHARPGLGRFLDAGGLDLQARLFGKGAQVTADLPLVAGGGPGGVLRIERVRFGAEWRSIAELLWRGSVRLSVEGIDHGLGEQGGAPRPPYDFALERLSLRGTAKSFFGVLGLTFSGSAHSLEIGGHELQGVSLRFELEQLAQGPIATWINARLESARAGASPWIRSRSYLEANRRLVSGLALRFPAASWSGTARGFGGSLALRGQARMRRSLARDPFVERYGRDYPVPLQALFPYLSVSLEFMAPSACFESLLDGAQLAQALTSGVLARNDSGYVMNVQLDKGKFLSNSHELHY